MDKRGYRSLADTANSALPGSETDVDPRSARRR
jgi:hypothetical protein